MRIEVEHLFKDYRDVRALHDVSLAVEGGGIVGLLGPNGAGKTTLVEIIEGLRSPSSGRLRVLGLDPARDGARLRERLGVLLQTSPLPLGLTPVETLRMIGAFFAAALAPEPILDRVRLAHKARSLNRTLSAGERQRLAIAMALINDPELVILDEPTSGLDPVARRDLHDLLRELRDSDRTILLATHYIEEAEQLCDRVVVLKEGRIIADGTPEDLAAGSEPQMTIVIAGPEGMDDSPLIRAGVMRTGRHGRYLHYTACNPSAALRAVSELVDAGACEIRDLRIRVPRLEDSYLRLLDTKQTREPDREPVP